MKDQVRLLIKDRLLLTTGITCLTLLFLQFIFIAVSLGKLPPLVPLLYQQPWGLKQIVHKEFLFILPGINVLFILMNVVFATLLYQKIPLLSRMFFWSTLFVCILSMVSSIRIVFLIL